MRKFDLSLRSSRSSYFATFRHQLTILSKTDALDEEKWLNMLGTFVKDWFRYESHFVHGRDSLVDILKESISSLQTHNVNRCGRSRHLARKLSLRRKRSSPNVFEMAATETITSIILIKLIRVSLGTVRHPRRFKIVVIDIQITLKQMLRDFIGIRVNRAKKSGMVNITSSVNSRERSGINTILHELN